MKGIKSFSREIKKQLADHYGDSATVELSEVLKTNGMKETGISIVFKDSDEVAIPVIYISDLYDEYKNGNSTIEECTDRIIDVRTNHRLHGDFENIAEIISWDIAKDNIYPRLINTDDNQELLEGLVNYPFLDLSVIFILRGSRDPDGGFKSIKITKELFRQYGVSMETLKNTALENMKNDNYRFEKLQNMICKIMECDEIKENEDEASEIEPGNMYVLSNSRGVFGAAGMLNEEMLRKQLKNNNTYIIPSSVHELLFVPAEGIDAKELTEMIQSVNETLVSPTDKLSDHPYYYEGYTQKLICA